MAKPYAHKVVRVTIFGDMFNGNEEWSTGFYLGHEDTNASNPTGAWQGALKTAWQAFFTNTTAHISGDWKTIGVKSALMNANGTTDLDNVLTDYYASPIAGGEGGGSLPPQVSLSAQLGTLKPRGLGSKGRMYLPGVRTPVSSTTGKIGSTEAGQIATALKTFFNAVNASFDAPGKLITASHGPAFALPGREPINVLVDRVRVGDVYDTQRRRRNGLSELYQQQSITA